MLLPGLVLLAASGAMSAASAQSAQSLLAQTFLLDARTGSSRSALARELSQGQARLTGGRSIDLAEWYTPSVPEMNLTLLTAVTPSFGMIWGISTGERGIKYRIDPGVWLGFVYRYELTQNTTISFTASTLLGGNFREKTCRATYGDQSKPDPILKGEQIVNCRLAASILPPDQTLRFLERRSGLSETRVRLRYEYRF